MPYRIRHAWSIEAEVGRVAKEQVERALAEMTSADLPLQERVHQVRKRCKKVRGLLRLVRDAAPQLYADENRWYRDTARVLAPIRDVSTALSTFNDLILHEPLVLAPSEAADVRRRLERSAASMRAAETEVRDKMQEAENRMRSGLKRIPAWDLGTVRPQELLSGLRRTYRRGRKGFRQALSAPDHETVHEWRKRAKYHWYHARLLRNIWAPVLRARAKESHRLETVLGLHHDLADLVSLSTPETGRARETDGWAGVVVRRQQAYLEEAETLGVRLYTEKASRFVDRYEEYLGAWRSESLD